VAGGWWLVAGGWWLVAGQSTSDGGVLWMTAGSGVIHSALPGQTEGVTEGFRLRLNLPGADKMQPPGYRDIPAG